MKTENILWPELGRKFPFCFFFVFLILAQFFFLGRFCFFFFCCGANILLYHIHFIFYSFAVVHIKFLLIFFSRNIFVCLRVYVKIKKIMSINRRNRFSQEIISKIFKFQIFYWQERKKNYFNFYFHTHKHTQAHICLSHLKQEIFFLFPFSFAESSSSSSLVMMTKANFFLH